MEKKKTNLKDVFENVEYIQVKKHRKQLMILEEKEAKGITRTQLARMVGDQLGEGTYDLVVKYFNNPKIVVSKITSIISKGSEPKQQAQDLTIFYEQIKKTNERIDNQANGNANIQTLMDMKDQSYKIQIDFYKARILMLEAENEKLKKEVGEGGGSNNLLELLAPVLLQGLTGKPAV